MGGKSFSGLTQLATDDCQRFPGLKGLFLRKVGKAGRESFEDLRRPVLKALSHNYRRQEGVLEFPNDSRIVLGHFQTERDIDAYLGIEYDVILVEEATTLTSDKYRDIRTCCRTSKPGWRARTYSTTNPGGVGHSWYRSAFIDPMRRGEEQDTRFIPATVRDNCYAGPDYIATLESLTGWKKRAWLDGDWDIAAGQFFTNFRHDLHVIKPFPIPRGGRVWCSFDYGWTHFTVCHLCFEGADGAIFIADEHAERQWLPGRHAFAIHSMLARHGLTTAHLAKFVAGHDVFQPRGMGASIAEAYQAEGITLQPGNVDRINGWGEMLARFGDPEGQPPLPPRLFIFDRCRRLIEQIPALEHDPHRPEDVLKVDVDDNGIGGDDAADSCRVGCMAFWVPPSNTVRRLPTAANPMLNRTWS